jgi:hypothetical protein
MADGRIDRVSLVTHQFPLERAAEASAGMRPAQAPETYLQELVRFTVGGLCEERSVS